MHGHQPKRLPVSMVEARRRAISEAKRKMQGLDPEEHAPRSSINHVMLVLREGTPEQVAALESGAPISVIAEQIRELHPGKRIGPRFVAKQRILTRNFRKAVIETEASCVSLNERVQVPENLDDETRRFAVSALCSARVHLTRQIAKLKKGE